MSARTRLEDRLVRHRAWVMMGVLILALVAVGLSGIASKNKDGGGSSADRPQVVFGATVQEGPDASVLTYTNGWVATAGTASIAVYAGSQDFRRGNGVLVVLRTIEGRQTLRQLVLHGAGAVTLLRPPNAQTEAQAFQQTLRFVTASGQTGTLSLNGDRVLLSG
jgi:hypothetical protein